MTRVRVIDDRDVLRAGIRATLAACSDIDVVDIIDHDTALADNINWDDLDVVIVDAADDRRSGDQFPGVAVVEQIRASTAKPQPSVIVVTGHAVHDGLRARMREAGADWFLHRTDTANDLIAAIRTPRPQYTGVPAPADQETLERLGWHRGARINEAIKWAVVNGQLNGLRSPTRRGLQQARNQFTNLTGLHPRNNDGAPPDRPQSAVSASQANRLLRWATKIKRDNQ